MRIGEPASVHVPEEGRASWLRGWELLILMAVAFLLFAPVLRVSLLSDDHQVVWRTGAMGVGGGAGFFRPLTDLTIAWGYAVHGPLAAGHRAPNIAVHGLNAWLMLLLARRWTRPSAGARIAWPAVALFLVFPSHFEPVIWIVGRGAALATLFMLVVLLVLGSSLPDRWRVWLSAGAWSLGALCYETALLLPLLLLPLMWWRVPVAWPPLRGCLPAWGAAFVLHFAWRAMAMGSLLDEGSYGGSFFSHSLGDYIANVPKVMARLFIPPHPDTAVQTWRIAAALLVLALVIGPWLWREARARVPDHLLFAVLWSLAVTCIMPMIAGVSTRTTESDRFLYMPSVFVSLLVAMALARIANNRIRAGVLAVLLAVSVLLILDGQRAWLSASRITERIVATMPGPPPGGRLLVTGLPDNIRGAYVFRNGFYEALLLAGRDTARVVKVPLDAELEVRPGDMVWPAGTVTE